MARTEGTYYDFQDFCLLVCLSNYPYLLFNLSSKSSALTDYDLERLGGDADGGLVGH